MKISRLVSDGIGKLLFAIGSEEEIPSSRSVKRRVSLVGDPTPKMYSLSKYTVAKVRNKRHIRMYSLISIALDNVIKPSKHHGSFQVYMMPHHGTGISLSSR